MTNLTFSTLITQWSFDPLVVLGVALPAVLYGRGTIMTRQLLPAGHSRGPRAWKIALFYSSLALVLLALESPIDALAGSLMWAHMVQHLMLIMLVAPLALLGDPALPVLRGLPSGLRRRSLGSILRWRWLGLVGQALAWLARPLPASITFTLTLWCWHWPPLYNLTLRNQGAHDLEHLMFVGSSLLLWSQVIDQTQFRCSMDYGKRALYMFSSAVQNHLLSVILAFATVPLYAYKALPYRPGGITALSDQQIAGGIMWVPGMLMYGTAFSIFFFKWLKTQTLPSGVSSFAELALLQGRAPAPYTGAPGLSVPGAADALPEPFAPAVRP